MAQNYITFDVAKARKSEAAIRKELETLDAIWKKLQDSVNDSSSWWVGASHSAFMRRANEYIALKPKIEAVINNNETIPHIPGFTGRATIEEMKRMVELLKAQKEAEILATYQSLLDGNNYNWDEIEALLNKPHDQISDTEYAALSQIYIELRTPEDRGFHQSCELRPDA